MILEFFGVEPVNYAKHVWEIQVELFVRKTKRGDRPMRRTAIYHQGVKLVEREAYV
jgi:L-cystine uptake protein TcyP (sodium:dicarboxylate symporter family)